MIFVWTLPFVLCSIGVFVFYLVKKKKCSVLVKAYISSGKSDTISTQIGESWTNLPYYNPVFEFDYQGNHYIVQEKYGTSAKKYASGMTVDLYIDPTNPNNYLTSDLKMRLILLSLVFLLIGLLPAFLDKTFFN